MAQLATMKMFMGALKVCFTDCVTDFKTSDLSTNEKNCIQNCTKR